jgi:hypothetical protein
VRRQERSATTRGGYCSQKSNKEGIRGLHNENVVRSSSHFCLVSNSSRTSG